MSGSNEQAELSIDVAEFLRTRDAVVTGLTTLVGAIKDLIHAYLKHTNAMLGGESAGVNLDSFVISNFLATANNAVSTAVDGVSKGKKKRVKRERDPNAPKRPLTAFFLYSGSARPIVKNDMPDAPAAEINNEILRRWKAMPDEGKAKWKEEYEKNNEMYKEAVAKYKASTGRDLTEAAESDAEEAADGAASSDSSSDSSSDEEPAAPAKPPTPPPAVKAKPAKAAGKRRSNLAAIAPSATVAASPSPSAQLVHKETPVPLPGQDLKELKSSKAEKRKKTQDEPAPEEQHKKKKARKGKAVSEEDPKPVAEPKKRKSKKDKASS